MELTLLSSGHNTGEPFCFILTMGLFLPILSAGYSCLVYETMRCDLIVFLLQHSWRHQPTSGGLPGHGAAIEGLGGCGEMYYYTITAVWRI